MKRFLLWILTLLGLIGGAAITGFFALGALVPTIPQTDQFPMVEDISIYNVDDAGTADFNGDGRLDRWTTNHSAAQWIALGGGPPQQGYAVGLAQDPRWPGLEGGSGSAPSDAPVRLFMEETRFVLEANSTTTVITGAYVIPWETAAGASGGASAEVTRCEEGPKCHRVTFSLSDGGRVWIEPVPAPSDGFEVTLDFAEDTDLSQIQVGALGLPVKEPSLAFKSRDRHGLALTDLDGDNAPEMFLSRGGVRGELRLIDPKARDEFFDWAEGRFVDVIDGMGIEKVGCPGRQTAWVDINEDGLQDIYQVCGRAIGASDTVENRLYVQQSDGTFTEAATDFGLALPGLGSFRFFRDAIPDAPLKMLWAAPQALVLYVKTPEGPFAEAWRIPRQGGNLDKISLTDLEGDGIWEAYIPSRRNALFLRPDTAKESLIDTAALGLPQQAKDAMFLDANGDGRLDFFAIPHGLFLRQEDGRFAQSGALDLAWAGQGVGERFAWFDADEDGDLDLWLIKLDGAQFPRPVRSVYNRLPSALQSLLETRYGKATLRGRYWRAVLYENTLGGDPVVIVPVANIPPGTPVAVNIEAGGTSRTEIHMVGETDSSRLSLTRPDIAVTLPANTTLGEIRPIP